MSSTTNQALKPAIATIFQTPDGATYSTKAEAEAHMAKPKVLEALNAITSKASLSEWLLSVKDRLREIYDTGVIRRVTNKEKGALEKDLKALVELSAAQKAANHPIQFPFINEHFDAILSSFRWPAVPRLKPEERQVAIRNSLMALCDGDADLADWIHTNNQGITEAFKAGTPKREVSQKAIDALAAYQAERKAKAAAAAVAAATAIVGTAEAMAAANESAELLGDALQSDATSDLDDEVGLDDTGSDELEHEQEE